MENPFMPCISKSSRTSLGASARSVHSPESLWPPASILSLQGVRCQMTVRLAGGYSMCPRLSSAKSAAGGMGGRNDDEHYDFGSFCIKGRHMPNAAPHTTIGSLRRVAVKA
jgi:hypothetical protein